MPTTYSDDFYEMDPFDPPSRGTNLSPVTFSFTDENDDGFIEIGDTFGGDAITGVYPGDVITVRIPGTGLVTITGVTFYVDGGGRYFTPIDGTTLEASRFRETVSTVSNEPVPVSDLFPPCFTVGTLIDTETGPRRVEDLQPGDRIVTADCGLQPLLRLERCDAPAVGKFAPVLFRAGAIGNNRDLWVSQEHRMLQSDWRAELYFGQPEVLVAAKHLVNGNDIVLEEGGRVEYVHLLFDRHQIVFAEGVPSESYLPSHAVKAAQTGIDHETLALFPDLAHCARALAETARPVAKRCEAMMMAA